MLCPYKAAIHPLASSSPAPFLCLSQTWGIFTERVPRPACPSLLGAQLVVSTSTLQDSGPSLCSQMRQTDGWLALNTLHADGQDFRRQLKAFTQTSTEHSSSECNDTHFYHISQATRDVLSTWELLWIDVTVQTYCKYIACSLCVSAVMLQLFLFPSPQWCGTSGYQNTERLYCTQGWYKYSVGEAAKRETTRWPQISKVSSLMTPSDMTC